MAGIESWLQRNKLERYRALFLEHEIDLDVLMLLEEADLEKMGIDAIGDRKRIVKAIADTTGERDPTPAGSIQSERRRVTLLFCDLVNYTGTLAELDVEDRHAALRQYYDWFEEIVASFNGTIQRFEGDGVRALFGFPGADENAPELAVRAGLKLVAASGDLKLSDSPMKVRVTIATGLAVVGAVYDGGATIERAVSGDIAHFVVRMKSVTPPGAIAISDETRRLADDFFTYENLGVHELGHPDPAHDERRSSSRITVWRVTGEKIERSRSAITYSRTHLAPLINREEEIRVLERRWERAARGHGQVVLLSGEAGIGKSRLSRDFRYSLPAESHRLMRCYCLPSYQNTALRPVVNELLDSANIVASQSEQTKRVKLLVLLRELGIHDDDTVSLFADLLSIPLGSENPEPEFSPEARRRRTLDALERTLVARAAEQPVLLIFEDLHWADATSLELLNRLIRRIAELPVLLILTFRPDSFEPPWPSRHYITSIVVNRLSPDDSTEMIGHVMSDRALHPAETREIVEITEGVPLFIEEICQAARELDLPGDAPPSLIEGDVARAPTPMPRPVNDALIARLNRLGQVKEIAQMAAAIGRTFAFDLLADIAEFADIDARQLGEHLDQLCAAQIIYQRSGPPAAIYEFKHGLLRDAAYANLLRSVRKRLHARIAKVLEERHAAIVDSEPELLAHHLTEASLADKAIPYWQQAGARAIERFANAEAIAHLEKALALVPSINDEPRRGQLELQIRLAMGSPLLMVEGHNARSVESTYARARELSRRIGASEEAFSALVGLWRFCLSDMQFDRALEIAQRSAEIARELGDDTMSQESDLMIGSCLLYMGEPARANVHFAQATESIDLVRRPALVRDRASDPSVMSLSWTSWTLQQLGYPEQALALNEEALDLARTLRHPYSLGFAQFFAAVLFQQLRDLDRAQESAQAVIDLAKEQDFHRWLAGSRVIKGWVLARRGNRAEGLRLVKEGIDGWTGRLGLPRLHTMLAEVYMETSEYEKALRSLEESAAMVEETRSFMYHAEVCRLTGVVCSKLAEDGFEEERFHRRAEQQLEKAFDIARSQEARGLELRAAVDLAEHWRANGQHQRAYTLLEETTSWFTEGFDAVDFRAARLQLDEMRSLEIRSGT